MKYIYTYLKMHHCHDFFQAVHVCTNGSNRVMQPGLALCGQGAERALVDGPVPCLGRTRRLGVAGPGHRLPYARDAGLAPVSPGRATTGSSALEQALIARFGTFGAVPEPFRQRSDNGLMFTSRRYTALVKSYGLRQEFITPHCPQQTGIVECVTRTLK